MALQSFKNGTTALITGYGMLLQPGIRLFVLFPLLTNLIVCAALFYWGWTTLEDYQQMFENWLPDWLSWLSWITDFIWPLYIFLFSLVMVYAFNTITNIIAAPFNALLAEQVEKQLGLPQVEASNNIAEFMATIIPSIKRELHKQFSNLRWIVLMLILAFIPGLNLLNFVIGAWLLAVEYLDYSAENHQLSFSDSIYALEHNRACALGFGGAVTIASLIPVINMIIVPAAVCGSTVLWHQKYRKVTVD